MKPHFISEVLTVIIAFYFGVFIGVLLPFAVKKINKRMKQKAIDELLNDPKVIDITRVGGEGIMDECFDSKSSLY